MKKKLISAKVKKALATGRLDQVFEILKEHFSIEGVVVQGRKMGRKLGFPTANLKIIEKDPLFLSHGVYVVRVSYNKTIFNGMANIGVRPTFEQNELSIEVNLFNFSEDLYGKTITIFFIERIRDEKKFPDLESLKAQILKDKNNAERILASWNYSNPNAK
jgi:riboflavin kinase / FMN adenylyltransferase